MSVRIEESGIDWVGTIPASWNARRLRYLGTLSSSGVDKKTYEGEATYKSVHYLNVYRNSLKEIGNADDYLLVSAGENQSLKCTLCEGDVLFTNSSETPEDIGHSVVISENLHNTLYGYHLMRFRPTSEINSHFSKYMFGSHYLRNWFSYRAYGMTRYGLTRSDFSDAIVVIPALLEQQQIASYLDSMCANMDRLIALQEEMISDLQAYKISIITKAVTKGLDPNVPMKDSGAEWIGMIQQDWEISRWRFLGEFASNGIDKKTEKDESLYLSIHYMDVYRNSMREIGNSEDYLCVSANENKAKHCGLQKGDVLITNSSETPEDIGHSTVVSEDLDNTLYGYHLMRFRPKYNLNLSYSKYMFGSSQLRAWFSYRAYGMTRYGLSRMDFLDANVAIPPISFQQGISEFLDDRCRKIDQLVGIKKLKIETLKEYKKSLIYECVTGKRDCTMGRQEDGA